MRITSLIGLIFILSMAAFSGCGGGGGAGVPAGATVTLTSSKAVVLADGSDAVTIQAEVKNADGTAAANGTSVAFSATAGTLSAPSAATTNGIASVTLTRAAISGASNQTVTVTATAAGVSGTKGVKFINQPTSVDVFIAISPAVTNLATLQFKLNNTAGATFDNAAQQIAAINAAQGGSLQVANFVANSTTVGLVHQTGFNTGTAPIIKATFAVSAGLPTFSVDSTATFVATDINDAATTPAITAANLAVTVTYNTELP